MNEKIKKREKLDTILAYILLVIIISAIVFVLYLKFIRREEPLVKQEEHLNNYITLNEISSKLNKQWYIDLASKRLEAFGIWTYSRDI